MWPRGTSRIQPPTATVSCTRQTIMAKTSLPAAKLAVPSSGSTIQQVSPGRLIRSTRSGSVSTASSPTTGTPGRILARPLASRCSDASSATVTTSPGPFIRMSSLASARKRGSSSEAAVSRISSATRPASAELSMSSADDAEQVLFLEDHVLDAAELDLGARPLAVDHLVADLDVERLQAAVLQPLALADSHDLALHGLLLGGVGNDDSGLGLGLGGHGLQQQPIVQGLEFHGLSFIWIGPLIGIRAARCQRAGLLQRIRRRSNCADAAASSATVSRAIS